MTNIALSNVTDTKTISSNSAFELLQLCASIAERNGIPMSFSVCDTNGGLLAFLRMDGASLLSREMSQNKAYSAVLVGVNTGELYKILDQNPALSLTLPHLDRLVAIDGGYLIKQGENIVGGLGVSGGTSEEDAACAREALENLSA